LLQARHNEAFLGNLEENFPDFFNDWKITVVFYTALHLVLAFAEHSGVKIGNEHKELFKAMKARGSEIPNLDVDEECASDYGSLFSVCRIARYRGIENPNLFERIKRRDLDFSKRKLEKIKAHLKAKGLSGI
jgi:hypothetical protein